MDTYDDYCWFPEPSLSTGSATKQFAISGNNAQHLGQPHRQPSSTGVYSIQQPFHHQQQHHQGHHHGGRHQQHHHQSPHVVVSSALSSPSSGYCSSEDCPGGFPPTFGGTVGLFSPRCVEGGAGDTHLIDSTSSHLVDHRLLQSPASTSSSSSSSSLAGSGATSPWQASSPGGGPTSDPCLGPQAAFSIQQQQQQQRLLQSHFTASQTMHQEFVDDYGAAWSGAIGFDDLETLWDPFGATGCDRVAPIRHQRLADASLETVGTASTAACRGDVHDERMDSSSTARDQNLLFGQYHHNGLAFTPNTSVGGEHSYVGIAASAIASQNGIGDRLATGSGNDDGSSVDYGFCMSSNGMSTGVLGETSLIDMLQRDAYLSSASLAVGYGGGFGLSTSSASVSGDLDTSTGIFGRFQHNGVDNMPFSSNQSSNAVQCFKATSSSALLHNSDVMVGGGSVAGYHLQHMAADMATGCDDTDDFDMFYRCVDASGNKKRLASDNRSINVVEPGTASWEGPSAAPSNVGGKAGSALFSGVFGNRHSVTPDTGKMAFGTAASVGPSARSRGLTVAKSCGSLLQMAPQYGSTGREQVTGNRNGGNSPAVLPAARPNRSCGANGAVRSTAAGCARIDVRGGRTSTANAGGSSSSGSLYPGLDDHRYTTKAMPTVQLYPPTKVQKTHRNGVKQSASVGRLNHVGFSSNTGAGASNSSSSSNTSALGSRSILEAFLRSTRPMDPNKGSNAALAAEGLLHHLHIGDRSPRKHRSLRSTSSSDADDDDDQQSGTLLKKLLTGELDQSDIQRGRDRSSTTRRHGGHGRRNHPASETATRKHASPPPAPPPSREEVVDDSLVVSSSMPLDVGVELSTVDVTDGLNPVTELVNSRLSIDDDDGAGLGIDMDLSLLNDPACMAIFGMIEDGDPDDYVWMSATAVAAAGDCYDLDDKISSSVLDEILSEGLRQGSDNLWHQQYADETGAGPGDATVGAV